jgi:hypothetical protein
MGIRSAVVSRLPHVRKPQFYFAALIAVGQIFTFSLSSMAGPHQLAYLGIDLVCGAVLVLLAAF